MRLFTYSRPADVSGALSVTGQPGTKFLGGGTNLVDLMKMGVEHPAHLVDICRLPLNAVEEKAGGIRIGAMARNSDVASHALIRQRYPLLSQALLSGASPQIRNMATIGGNLCQRPRCWYFRGGFGLLPKSESGKDLVTDGENRYHAILGNDGPAKFVSPSSIAPVLMAYGAVLRLIGPHGVREQALERFYVIPKTEAEREHDLRPNEILAELILPPPRELKVAHYEIRQKQAFDWPLAVAAVGLNMKGSALFGSRLVLGYVAPIPWRSGDGEVALNNAARIHGGISEEVARAAAEGALQNAKPLSRNGYKVQLAKVAVRRAIMKAASGGAA